MTDSTLDLNRRRLLKAGAIGGIAAPGFYVPAHAEEPTAPPADDSVRRYARLGKTGYEISDISFGSSRLRSGEERLVHYALDRGVNYIDTAESYTSGQSETVIGNALKGRRDKVILASKQWASADTTRAEMMHELEASLRRLQTDHIEIYFNHAVNAVDRLENPEWHEFVAQAKAQGKIAYTGLSGHAGRLADVLEVAIDKSLVDVVLVGYNFGQDPKFYERITRSFDFVARQPELPRLLKKAKDKGIGVVAMKTLMGARLNDMRAYEASGSTYAQAAFRWTLGNADVDALVVSMTDEAQISEYLGASGAKALAQGDMDLLRRYAVLNGATYCKHACNDCSGACPVDVPISDVLRTRMYATDYQDIDFARSEYRALATNASACLGCSGAPCAGACPHGIDISALCAPTHQLLA
ncbi:MAG: aldo/keto reductase [Pseudomonadota bacterium]